MLLGKVANLLWYNKYAIEQILTVIKGQILNHLVTLVGIQKK